MATYTPELDNALLPVPWIAKVDSETKPYMLKYAPHPSKPGYTVLLTDLTKVYFEPLAGIRVLARQREVEEKFGRSQSQRDGASSLDLGGEEAVDEVLEEIASLMGDMDDVEMDVKAGDLYDLDVTTKSSRGNWLYHMTEIRTDCLEIITRHVIHPLALSIASSRRPASTTNDQIVELVSSSTILGAMNRHSSHAKKSAPSAVKAKSPKAPAKSPSPLDKTEEQDKGDQSDKRRLVRRRPEPAKKPTEAGPSTGRNTRTKSPSPVKTRTETHASRSVVQDDAEDESMPPEEDEVHRSSTPEPAPAPANPPQSRKKKARSPTDDEMEEDKSPAPPVPPPSQKTQQEKDEEEEEELAKKREEMKKRMGAGGGGRLVRRRFG